MDFRESFKAFVFSLFFLVTSFAGWSGSIEVLGDVEGNWTRVESFLRKSKVITRSSNDYFMKPGSRFVFLGDAMDHGPDGMKIVDTLLRLRKKYPRQVFLIIGNRDANKPSLNNPANFETILRKGNPTLQVIPDKIDEALAAMAAGSAFQFRQDELGIKLGRSVSREETATSLIADVSPGGRLAELLTLGQLAYFDEETRSLFVHGGLPTEIGMIPYSNAPFEPRLVQWIENLNIWFRNAVERAVSGEDSGKIVRDYSRDTSGVVYGRFSDRSGNPHLPTGSTREYLIKNGVIFIVAGHTPVGEVPAVITDEQLRLLLVDTSYSVAKDSALVSLSKSGATVQVNFEGSLINFEIPMTGSLEIGSLRDEHRLVLPLRSTNSWLGWRVDATNRFTNSYTHFSADSDPKKCGKQFK